MSLNDALSLSHFLPSGSEIADMAVIHAPERVHPEPPLVETN